MEQIMLALVLAVTVEAIIEYGKTFIKFLEEGKTKKIVLQGISIILSIFLCFGLNLDLYKIFDIHFKLYWIGIILTGTFISRGANYVNDFVNRAFFKNGF